MLNGVPVSVMIGIDRTKHLDIYTGANTDDLTSSIQALVSEMPSYGTLVFPRGVFHRGTLTIQDKTGFKILGNGAKHVLVGTNAYAFSPLGTVQDLEIAGHFISGDGAEASNHKGFYCASGQTLAGVTMHHCTLEDLVNGISLNANTGGSISGGSIHNNVIRRVVGIASGFGYGIHIAKGASDFVDTEIFSNWISYAQRHAIYIARGSSINCHHNTIVGHRSTLSTSQQADATDGWSKFRPAINVARSSHVRVESNVCRNGYDGFILVSADPDAGGALLYDVSVLGNKGLFPRNAVPLYACGDSTPATTGVPENVTFAGNTGVGDGINTDLIRHYSGKNVSYRGNRLTVKNVTATVNAAEIRNSGEAAGGSTYN